MPTSLCRQKAMSVEDAAAAGGVVPLQDASNLLIASRQPSNATLQSKGSSRDSIFSQLMSSVSGFFGGGGWRWIVESCQPGELA